MMRWLEMVRAGGGVRRYHTVATLGEETVGKHSFGVAMLCVALTEGEPSAELLKAALYHDLAEQATGDIPAPVKWAHPELKNILSYVEEGFEREFDLAVRLSSEDQLIFRWADMLDLLYFCREQRNLGNRNMNVIFARGVDYLSRLEPLPAGQRILKYLVEDYNV